MSINPEDLGLGSYSGGNFRGRVCSLCGGLCIEKISLKQFVAFCETVYEDVFTSRCWCSCDQDVSEGKPGDFEQYLASRRDNGLATRLFNKIVGEIPDE
jgi:hypothetical protein